MTHAARTHSIFETVERIQSELQAHAEAAETLRQKLIAAEAEAEKALLMADALSLLREISTKNLSESQRARRAGVIERLGRQIGAR